MLWQIFILTGLLLMLMIMTFRYFFLGRSLNMLERYNHPQMVDIKIAVETVIARISPLEPSEQFEEMKRLFQSAKTEDVALRTKVTLFLSLLNEVALAYNEGSIHSRAEHFFDETLPKYYVRLEPFIRVAQEEAARDGIEKHKALDEAYERFFTAVQ